MSALSFAAFHHVTGAAHGVTHLAGESLRLAVGGQS